MNFIEAHKEFNFVEINSLSELDKQYKFLAKKRHPDVGGTNSSFQKLSLANEALKDHISKYKTTNYKAAKKMHTYSNQESPSFYDCEPFYQKKGGLISLVYFLCFIFGIKVKTENGVTFIILKNNKLILTKKEVKFKKYSTLVKSNGLVKRVSFSNKKSKVEISKNLFVWFI